MSYRIFSTNGNMLKVTKQLLNSSKVMQDKPFSSSTCWYGIGTLVRNTDASTWFWFNWNFRNTTKFYFIKNNKPVSRQFCTCKIKLTSKNSQSRSYKELDVEKLLGSINKGDKKVIEAKTKHVVQSRHTQLQEAIKKAAAKTLEDWKSMLRYSLKFTMFLVFTLVPISVISCWYSPDHRARTSKYNPQWGKMIDLILDPLDDDAKMKAGIAVEEFKNIDTGLHLKENAASFKESVANNLNENRNTSLPSSEKSSLN